MLPALSCVMYSADACECGRYLRVYVLAVAILQFAAHYRERYWY